MFYIYFKSIEDACHFDIRCVTLRELKLIIQYKFELFNLNCVKQVMVINWLYVNYDMYYMTNIANHQKV